MATGRHRHHRRDNKHKSKGASTSGDPTAGPTSVHDVPDHLLTLILLRLDSSASILRAAAACKRLRRAITDAGFLSTYHSLNATRVAGHYHAFDPDWVEYGSPPITSNPVFVPSSSLTVDSRRFSLDFLPHSDSGWAIADSRGSLLLLFKRRTGWAARAGSHCCPDLLVCEPLTQRYQGILCPEDYSYSCIGVFLLDGNHVGIGMPNFRVITVLYDYHTEEPGGGMPVACVFTPGNDGGWSVLPSASTNSDAISLAGSASSISFAGRANGSLYWGIGGDGSLLALDVATTQFSRLLFPADDSFYDKWSFRVIGGENDALRIVRLTSNNLKVLARIPGSDEWKVEKLVRLLEATQGLPGLDEDLYFGRNAMIIAAHETYILVTPQEKTWLFSVELETLALEREHVRNKYPGTAYPCELPWPPALKACVVGQGRRTGSRR